MPCRATPPARVTSRPCERIAVRLMLSIRPGHFPIQWLHPSRRGQKAAPQDEVLDPDGEERGNAARLEPRGHGIRHHASAQAELAPGPSFRSDAKRRTSDAQLRIGESRYCFTYFWIPGSRRRAPRNDGNVWGAPGEGDRHDPAWRVA